MKPALTLALAIAILWAAPSAAQLDLQASFGVDGRVALQGLGPNDERIIDMRVDAAERIVFVFNGFGSSGVGRLLPGGTLDPDFGDGGIVFLSFSAAAVAIQPNGGIVAAGVSRDASGVDTWRLARLFADGSVDSAFGTNGELDFVWFGETDDVNALAVDANGDIIVGGRAFDPALGSGLAMAIFNSAGQVLHQRFTKLVSGNAEWCEDVLVQGDGRIVCVGLTRNFNAARMIAVRYEGDLDIDTSFGVDGVALVDTTAAEMEAQSGALTASGQIVLGGRVDRPVQGLNLAIVRLNSDGSVDTSFGVAGLVETQIVNESSDVVTDIMVVGTDLLVAATSQDLGDFVVLRFDVNGDPVTTFGTSGQVQVDFNGLVDQAFSLAMQQGDILLGGSARSAVLSESNNIGLLRLLSNGNLDPSFADAGVLDLGLTGPARSIVKDAAARADGGMVSVFWSGPSFSSRDFGLIGTLVNGEPDPDFGDGGFARLDFDNDEDTVEGVAVQPDGRIVAVGAVKASGSTQGTDFGIARFMPDGSLDTDFGSNGKVVVDMDNDTDTAREVHILADGRILVAGEGQFFNSGGDGDLVVIRLLADGTLDTSFGVDGVARADSGATFEFTFAMTTLQSGVIVVGGTASSDFVLAAFNADGSTASGFGTNGIVTLDFAGESDALQALLTVPNWNGQGERIVAVGSSRTGSSTVTADFAAAMFTSAGQLETGFGNAGMATFDLSAGSRDEATDAVLWQDQLVLSGFSGTSLSANNADFALMGLDLNGQPITDFSVDGPSTIIDFFGSADEAQAVVAGANDLTLVGTVIDPMLPNFLSQLTGLVRLRDTEMLFKDGFENP